MLFPAKLLPHMYCPEWEEKKKEGDKMRHREEREMDYPGRVQLGCLHFT